MSIAHDSPSSRVDDPRAPSDQPGSFVISLDCELYWGVRDKRRIEDYRENLLGDRRVVPRLLDLFREFGIRATWAFVGLLFYGDRESMLADLPDRRPGYADPRLSAYGELGALGEDEAADPFHFGRSLIEAVQRHPEQEIASHTFSHYYCLEQGQCVDDFRADLEANVRVAHRAGVELQSLVFPRNQINPDYLAACYDAGIRAFRGNSTDWLYRPLSDSEESASRRAIRYADAFVNLSGKRVSRPAPSGDRVPVDVPASRFLYPRYPRTAPFDGLRIRRIAREMRAAAERGACYHLWWHPHNFGMHQDENLALLRRVLEEYRSLHDEHGLASRSMREVADAALAGRR